MQMISAVKLETQNPYTDNDNVVEVESMDNEYVIITIKEGEERLSTCLSIAQLSAVIKFLVRSLG